MAKSLNKGEFNLSSIVGNVDKVVKNIANNEARSFRRTVQTWQNKPTFYVIPLPDGFGYRIGTDSIIYAFVNWGTKAHLIAPRGKGNGGIDPYTGKLVKGSDSISYQSNFTPKTVKGRIGAKAGGKSGAYITYPKGEPARHSGVEARRFDEIISSKQPKRMANEIIKEMGKSIVK